jgi:hypothetical protein
MMNRADQENKSHKLRQQLAPKKNPLKKQKQCIMVHKSFTPG